MAKQECERSDHYDLNYNSASFFQDDFSWKGINVSLRITSLEKNCVFKWISKNNPSSSHWQKASNEDNNLNNAYSSYNLGTVSVNDSRSFPDLQSVYVDNDFFSSVFISMISLPSGLCILTFYFNLNDSATHLIKNVNVKGLSTYSSFPGYNIFSKKNRYTISYDSASQSEDVLINNFNVAISSAKEVVSHLLKQMKCNIKDFVITSDFYMDQDKPYFGTISRDEQHEVKELALITPWADFSDMRYSTDPNEHFISVDRFKELEINYIYLLCKKSNTFGQFNNYPRRSYSIGDAHMVFIAPCVLDLEINLITKRINFVGQRQNKISSYHDELFTCVSFMEEMKSWVHDHERNNRLMVNPKYKPVLKSMTGKLTGKSERILELSKRLYAHSKNRVEVSNIKYTQANSFVVLILILLQIILAAMTIEWNDSGRWYYPLIGFFKNL